MTDEKPSTPADHSTTAAAAEGSGEAAAEAAAALADGEHDPAPAKSAFEAAIARKKAAGQARSAHLDGGAKVGGATASHKTSRTFRRKSG